jgi:uncharacterized protein YjbI with pentapeptide repeats
MKALILPGLGTLFLLHLWLIDAVEKKLRDPERNLEIKSFIQYLWLTGRAQQLERIDLVHEDLSRAYLPSSGFYSANFSYVDFSEANLRQAVFIDVNLKGAQLISTNLKGALISKSNLENANLANADLQGATIRNNSLKGAVLYGANLKDANLENLNLNEVKNASKLNKNQLEKVASLCNVQLPDHIKINIKSNCTPYGVKSW